MNKKELEDVMIFQLKNFNRTENKITSETVHGTVLAKDDGIGGLSSATLYKSFIRYSIKHANHEEKKWPNNWLEKTVDQLAQELI
jgi:hypothetical protein